MMHSGRRLRRGFTLVELVVVLALFGLLALIAGGFVSASWQKMRLESTVGDVDTFLGSAYQQMVDTRGPVFVRLQKDERRIHIARDAAFTHVLAEYDLPAQVSLSMSSTTGVDCNWPATDPTDGPWILSCDTLGRTVDPVTGGVVAGVQTLTMTHVDMVSRRLTPVIRYTVRVLPLWRADVLKQVQ
jgi:prepilin-type N-terminal cleavage/methylation domain-containing protein